MSETGKAVAANVLQDNVPSLAGWVKLERAVGVVDARIDNALKKDDRGAFMLACQERQRLVSRRQNFLEAELLFHL